MTHEIQMVQHLEGWEGIFQHENFQPSQNLTWKEEGMEEKKSGLWKKFSSHLSNLISYVFIEKFTWILENSD